MMLALFTDNIDKNRIAEYFAILSIFLREKLSIPTIRGHFAVMRGVAFFYLEQFPGR